mgnify:CR=1 FL=1
MGKILDKYLVNPLSASLVLHVNDFDEVAKAIMCVLESNLVGEIFLLDNSPSDKLKKLKKINPKRINYVFIGNNIGFGRAHNVAIKKVTKSNYKYHLILNPDIEFKPGCLELLYNFMENNVDCGVASPKILNPGGELQTLCKKLPTIFELVGKQIPITWIQKKVNAGLELHKFNYDQPLNTPWLSGCFMLFRVGSFNKVGMFDERFFMYMEDIDLSRRFHKHYKTMFYPKAEIIHGHRSGWKSNKSLFIKLLVSTVKYFSKHGWLFDSDRVKINKEYKKRVNALS